MPAGATKHLRSQALVLDGILFPSLHLPYSLTFAALFPGSILQSSFLAFFFRSKHDKDLLGCLWLWHP